MGSASHRISMIGAPAQPIPIGSRWRDSGASNLQHRHTGFVAAAALEHPMLMITRGVIVILIGIIEMIGAAKAADPRECAPVLAFKEI
jgi:hypothetical protein